MERKVDVINEDVIENADDDQTSIACPTCATDDTTPIYVIGSVHCHFSSLGIQREYEFERAALSETAPNEQHYLHQVLSECSHLARAVCWTLRVQNVAVYHLLPRSETELNSLIDAIKPEKDGQPTDTDVIVGWKGPDTVCAGLKLPTLFVETLYTFDAKSLIEAMAASLKVGKAKASDFTSTARDIFERIRQIAGNFGEGPNRAPNWAAVRFAPLYETAANAVARDYVLAAIEVRPSLLASEDRVIVDLVVTYQPRQPGAVEKYFVSVDLSDLYPHPLSTGMQPFFERS